MKLDWLWTLLSVLSVAAAAMALLCWPLWRHRGDRLSREEQELYHEAKVKAEMGVTAEDDNPRTYSAEIAAHCKTPEEVAHALSVRFGPVHIDTPADQSPALREASEALIAAGSLSVSIGPWRRPGEPDYLVAYVYDSTRHRHVFATPELREKPMADQVADLVRQLSEFQR